MPGYETSETHWRNIEYCDCEGITDDGEEFIIEKYASSPVPLALGARLWNAESELTFDIPTSTEFTDTDGGDELAE